MAAAGYSGTPLPKKLGIKPGMSLVILDTPEEFESTLGPLPTNVVIHHRLPTDSLPGEGQPPVWTC